jgi:HlyD family secretion protein
MKQFDRTAGARKARRPGQTVYELGAPEVGDPKPIEIRTGITDGRYTQVTGGELKAGQTVVVGLVTAKAEASKAAPGMGPGGGGGPRRF